MNQTEELNRGGVDGIVESFQLNLNGKKIRVVNRCKTGKSLTHRIKIENSKNSKCKRSKSVSKSPLRSRSQRCLLSEKCISGKKKSISPPGGQIKSKLRKTISSKMEYKGEKFQKVIGNEVSNAILKEKVENCKKNFEEVGKKNLKLKPKKSKGSSCRGVKILGKTKKLKNIKKVVTEDERSSSRENKDLKIKSKFIPAKKSEGKSLEIDHFLVKMKRILGKSKKNPEPKPKKLIKSKKASMKTFDQTNFDELMATHEIFKTSEKLHKKKPAPRIKKQKNTEEHLSRPQTSLSKSRRKIILKNKKKKTAPNACQITPVKYKQDSNSTSMHEKAAKKLQRWFRKVLKKKKELEEKKSEYPDFEVSEIIKPHHRRMETNKGQRRYPQSIDFWNPERVSQSQDLVEMCMVPKNSYRNRNYNNTREQASGSLTLMSSSSLVQNHSVRSCLLTSSFQDKRPKELDIEHINAPLLTTNYELSEKSNKEDLLIENKSTSDLPEENKHSFQSDSLEKDSQKTKKKIPYFLIKGESIKDKSKKPMKKLTHQLESLEESKEIVEVNLKNSQNNEKAPRVLEDEKRGENNEGELNEFKDKAVDDESLEIVPMSSPNLEMNDEMPQITLKFVGTPSKSQLLDMQAEMYFKSIGCDVSDKDSLESNIEISSSIIRDLENSLIKLNSNNSSIDSGINTPYKIPISSPNISFNINDILSEILDSEIILFSNSTNFKPNEKQVDPTLSFIENIVSCLFKEFKRNEADFLDIVNTPGFTDPLSKLQTLQNTNVGELRKTIDLETMIPQEICEIIQYKLANEQFRGRKIYIQMVFDCVNEAFNYIRPFGLRGVPDPWVNHSRLLFGEGELNRVQEKTMRFIEEWEKIKGGAYLDKVNARDKDKVQCEREERMSFFLCFDVNFEEESWVLYVDEETQTKCDVADIILDELFLETVCCVKNLSM